MNSVYFSVKELHSIRFGLLCRELGVLAPEDRWPIFGHLVEWHATWSVRLGSGFGRIWMTRDAPAKRQRTHRW